MVLCGTPRQVPGWSREGGRKERRLGWKKAERGRGKERERKGEGEKGKGGSIQKLWFV